MIWIAGREIKDMDSLARDLQWDSLWWRHIFLREFPCMLERWRRMLSEHRFGENIVCFDYGAFCIDLRTGEGDTVRARGTNEPSRHIWAVEFLTFRGGQGDAIQDGPTIPVRAKDPVRVADQCIRGPGEALETFTEVFGQRIGKQWFGSGRRDVVDIWIQVSRLVASGNIAQIDKLRRIWSPRRVEHRYSSLLSCHLAYICQFERGRDVCYLD